MTHELDILVQRLDKLERTNRIYRTISVGCLACFCIALFGGAVLLNESGEVICKDKTGTTRAQLGVQGGNPKTTSMNLHESTGQLRVAIESVDKGPGHITIVDANGRPRIDMGIDGNGNTFLILFDKNGNQKDLGR